MNRVGKIQFTQLGKYGLSLTITKDCGIHGLRHAFATHLLEAGVDVPTIQHVMGHGHISSTLRYFHLARKHLGAARSPLDLLPRPEPMRR